MALVIEGKEIKGREALSLLNFFLALGADMTERMLEFDICKETSLLIRHQNKEEAKKDALSYL